MTELWNKYGRPDQKYLKNFKRPGGFAGTAIDPMWMIECATKEWGEYGQDWSAEILTDEFIPGGEDLGILHYMVVSVRGAVGIGCTPLVSKNKYGPFLDEECPKKTFTDALTNALSKKGFAHAIYMGQYNGSKYITPDPDPVKKSSAKQAGVEVDPLLVPDGWPLQKREAVAVLFERGSNILTWPEFSTRAKRILQHGDYDNDPNRVTPLCELTDEQSKHFYGAVSEMLDNIEGRKDEEDQTS